MSEPVNEHFPEIERLREMDAELFDPALYSRLVEILPDALVIVNDSGKIVLFNAQAELLFGWYRHAVIGQPVELLIPEALRSMHEGHRASFMTEPRSRPMGQDRSLAARHKSGREFSVRINLSPIVAPQGTFVAAIIRRD